MGFDGPTNAPRQIGAPYVVLVSFDGFAWNLMEKHSAPNFQRVAAEGVRAERMIPTFPTTTFPTHYSLATGMYAESHGLVGNRFWAPDKQAYYSLSDRVVVEDGSRYRGEPIWVTAERQGMVSASFFFVGSEAEVRGLRPSYWYRFDASVPHDERVDGVLDWLSMPEDGRPHMITLYFEDIDAVAHDYGMDSPETSRAVARVDASLGRLLCPRAWGRRVPGPRLGPRADAGAGVEGGSTRHGVLPGRASRGIGSMRLALHRPGWTGAGTAAA